MPSESAEPDPLDDLRYGEAMATFRSVMAASVSTATALFAGSLTLLGFAVDGGINGALVMLAAMPMFAMSVLFFGWRWYNQQTAAEAVRIAPDGLAYHLGQRPGRLLIALPIIAASGLFVWGLVDLI